MFKILRLPVISRPLAWILLYSFMMMVSGCYYFKVIRPADAPGAVINKMQDAQKFIILHVDQRVWQMTSIKVNEESLSGVISPLYGHERYKTVNPDGANRYINSTGEGSYLLNEVHLYASEYSESSQGNITIPIRAVQKIEIYDKDKGATVASWVLGIAGASLAAFGIILLIAILTKSSCPFVYVYDGNEFQFAGEIFSGATQPGLERDDYLPLPGIAVSEGSYKLKLTNEVHEIQSVNLARLLIIDHRENSKVLIDKYGNVQTFSNPISPVSAINGSGKNLLPLTGMKDTLNYSGDEKIPPKNGIEAIIMKFIKPHGCQSGKLVVRAKNSFWLDALFTKFHELFGVDFNKFSAKQESAPGEKLKKFLLDQKIPLSVYIEKNGKWQFMDYFNIEGPMAFRDDILPLNLEGVSSDTINIKLETGFLFWQVDYAGMDFSKNEVFIPSEITASKAIDKNGKEIKDLILSSDKSYLVLKEVGDEVMLNFNAPIKQKTERTLFLHTRGHYKILRDVSGRPDKKTLKTFRRPNRFPEFSIEKYNQKPLK